MQLFQDNEPSEEDCLANGTPRKLIAWWRDGDGPADDFDFGFPNDNKRDNINNTLFVERKSAPPQFTSSMDGDNGHARLPAASSSSARVKPLQPRKASSQTHLARSKPDSNSHNSHENITEKPAFPPRTSSIRSHPTYCGPATSQPHATQTKPPSHLNGDESSIAANSSDHRHNNLSTNARSPASSTGQSTNLGLISGLLLGSPSAIMGDFVPIDSPNMAGLTPDLDPADDRLRG